MRSDVQLVPGPPLETSDGAVAQLGERELCKLEVVGSIPIGSTKATGSFVQGSIAKSFVDGQTQLECVALDISPLPSRSAHFS